jgi:four helix bundle protein
MRSAAVSVPANVAEGIGSRSLREFRKHLRIAQGSQFEHETYLHRADRLGYFPEDGEGILALRTVVGKILHGSVKRLGSQIQTNTERQSIRYEE